MLKIPLPKLAVAAGWTFISVLGYGSQVLFKYLEPGPLNNYDFWVFNGLIFFLWVSFLRAYLTDPGTLPRSRSLDNTKADKDAETESSSTSGVKLPHMDNGDDQKTGIRWCKKCEAVKPPRTHHCKVCKKCIPKMDHHCPWSGNCVSHTTFPHFIRLLFYAVASMCKLAQLQSRRVSVIWNTRNRPSYLGPSAMQLGILFTFCIVNALAIFGMGVVLLKTIYNLATNITSIESWEIERHENLVRRAKKRGGVLDGPDGTKIRVVKQEFPYDIGIWSNICQGMGGGILTWFWPFASTPSVESGMSFEVNDFEEPGTQWPPPDPDRMPRAGRPVDLNDVALELDEGLSDQERLKAFRERQYADLRRRTTSIKTWQNSEGEKLEDFGVDEESEGSSKADGGGDDEDEDDDDNEDEDNVPIGELMARRKRN